MKILYISFENLEKSSKLSGDRILTKNEQDKFYLFFIFRNAVDAPHLSLSLSFSFCLCHARWYEEAVVDCK